MADAQAAPQPDSATAPVRAVAASVVCLTASILPGFLTGALGSSIKEEFGLSDRGLGLAVALTFLLSGLATIHAGELADRVGFRRSLVVSMGVAMAGYLWVALLARSLATLTVGLVVAGAGLTLVGPAAKVLVADHVRAERHGIAFGVHMAGIPLAPLLAGLTVPVLGWTVPVAGWTAGWRWMFVGGATMAAVGLLMVPSERAQAVEAPLATAPAAGRFAHVRMPPLFVFGVAAVLASSAVTGTASFFVVASTSAGVTEDVAGLVLSAATAGVILARIALGLVADRIHDSVVATVVALLFLSAAGYLLMAGGAAWMYVLGGQAALLFGWSWPALMVVALVRMNPHAPGLATAFIMSGLNLGAVVGPAVFGLVSDAASPSAALVVSALGTLVAAALNVLGRLIQTRSLSPA